MIHFIEISPIQFFSVKILLLLAFKCCRGKTLNTACPFPSQLKSNLTIKQKFESFYFHCSMIFVSNKKLTNFISLHQRLKKTFTGLYLRLFVERKRAWLSLSSCWKRKRNRSNSCVRNHRRKSSLATRMS